MWTDGTIYRDCVIENGKMREITKKERMLADWCFARTDNHGVSEIGYSTFEMEPYRAEWFEEAEEAYLAYAKKKHSLSKKDMRMILMLNGVDEPKL